MICKNKNPYMKFIYLFFALCLFLQFSGIAKAAEGAEIREASGTITNMKGWELGVGEILYRYSADTVFYDQDNRVIGSGYFGRGTKVNIKWYINGRDFMVTEVHKQ